MTRLHPIPVDQWDDAALTAMHEAFPDVDIERFRAKGAPTVFATMLHNPALAGPFNRYANVLLQEPAIGHRGRELMLLRVAWRTRAEYEWVHHVKLADRFGLDADDITGVMAGNSASWTDLERELVSATDQLVDTFRIDDATWARLAEHLDERQLAELPFIVGTYTLLAMAFNSWGVRVEDSVDTTGVPPLPD